MSGLTYFHRWAYLCRADVAMGGLALRLQFVRSSSSAATKMLGWRRHRVFLLVCLFVHLTAFSAVGQYHFDSWTAENGLPHNWLKAIRQTRDGYIWVTTT